MGTCPRGGELFAPDVTATADHQTRPGNHAATAQAAALSVSVMAEYPALWPEAVRALIVHSAEWDTRGEGPIPGWNEEGTPASRLRRRCGMGRPRFRAGYPQRHPRVDPHCAGHHPPLRRRNHTSSATTICLGPPTGSSSWERHRSACGARCRASSKPTRAGVRPPDAR
ncbi:S8 family serine peptidase [Amycolatopsis plumensis]|uniref:S8 family serine peptidase n=1 Tax=Amycolatopsis plumensis TaxID=236508 RepID=A0ABV5UIC8_9PSEU